MDNTIKRVEVSRITRITLDEIDALPGVYCVHCPKTGYTKFGRAMKLRDRLQDYASMCLNGGGVVILAKTMSPRMINVAEDTLLSIATVRLQHVDKNEYFLCDTEEKARKILEDSILYLTKYYVLTRRILEPLIEDMSTAANDANSATDLYRRMDNIFQSVWKCAIEEKQAEHMEIYYLTHAAAEAP